MDIEKAKATIRHLLNLSNDPAAAKGEIDNAMRFAARLMEQHQLSDEDLSQVDDVLLTLERAEMGRQFTHVGGARQCEWETDCASFVCQLIGGVKYYMLKRPSLVKDSNGLVQLDDKGRQQFKPRIVFYGVAEDCELASELFNQLIVTIAAMARLKWGSVYRGDGRCYCEGFVSALFGKLHEDRRAVKLEAEKDASQKMLSGESYQSSALVAIESRKAVVEKKGALAERYAKETLKLKFRHSSNFSYSKSHNSDAHRDGQRDGQRHSVSAERRRKLAGPC